MAFFCASLSGAEASSAAEEVKEEMARPLGGFLARKLLQSPAGPQAAPPQTAPPLPPPAGLLPAFLRGETGLVINLPIQPSSLMTPAQSLGFYVGAPGTSLPPGKNSSQACVRLFAKLVVLLLLTQGEEDGEACEDATHRTCQRKRKLESKKKKSRGSGSRKTNRTEQMLA